MALLTKTNAEQVAKEISKWNKTLKVELSQEGDSVIASAKALDVDADDLRKPADIISDESATVTLGRSGANFRMIIW